MSGIATAPDAPRTQAQEARPRSRRLPVAGHHVVTIAVALAIVGLAFNSGSFGVTVRNPIAIGVWWAVVLGVGTLLWPVARIPRAAWVGGGLLAAYAALMGLSALWAPSIEGAFAQFNLATMYLGVFALVVVASRRGSVRQWSDGIALGIGAVALIAVTVRLFPHEFPAANVSGISPTDARPSYPVGYWNGLAVLLAMGVGPMLRIATAARAAVARGLAVASLPVFYVILDLTLSRGGAIATAACVVVFVAATSERTRAVAAILAAGIGCFVVSEVINAREVLEIGPLRTDLAASEGRTAVPLIALAAFGSGLLYLMIERFVPRSLNVPRKLRVAVVALALVALVAGVVAADPAQRFESFKEPPGASDSALLSSAGNGRWQLWTAAVDEFTANPVLGGGGGSYEAWWAEHAEFSYFTRYAHSLYLESLAELGPLGLLFILAIAVFAISAARRHARVQNREGRVAVAAVAGGLAAFAAAAAVDWMWQLTAVGAVAIALFAVLIGPASEANAAGGTDRGRPRLRVGRLAFVLVGLALMVSLAVPWLAARYLDESRDAVARTDLAGALSKAEEAETIEPWAASPKVQIALVREQQQRPREATVAIDEAIDANPKDWRTWLIAARISASTGSVVTAREQLARARALNPRSPIFEP